MKIVICYKNNLPLKMYNCCPALCRVHSLTATHLTLPYTSYTLTPNVQVFEDDALAWEDRLNRINDLFDVWIDVQRRWVYLEGIFAGSADIKHLLPNESQRFQRYFILFVYQSLCVCVCCVGVGVGVCGWVCVRVCMRVNLSTTQLFKGKGSRKAVVERKKKERNEKE